VAKGAKRPADLLGAAAGEKQAAEKHQ